MRFIIIAFVLLFLSLMIGLNAYQDQGYVQIHFQGWTLETTVAFSVVALLVLFTLIYFTLRFVAGLSRAPRRVSQWHHTRRIDKGRKALTRGLIELGQGHWRQSETSLLKYIKESDAPLLNYLAAARAAQEQGDSGKRDQYLQLAQQQVPHADLAVGLTQAQLQLAQLQTSGAVETLTKLRQKAPKNGLVLRMLMRCYSDMGDWESLLALLPTLRKRHVIGEDELQVTAKDASIKLLNQAMAISSDSRALDEAWNHTPFDMRRNSAVLSVYIRHLMALGENERPESLLHAAIKQRWDDTLVYLYGLVEGVDPSKQLARAEHWLKHHDDNATLLLTLGRLSMRSHMWGKARHYLEDSLKAEPRPETYMLLGDLLEQLDERGAASEQYRKGLGLRTQANGKTTALLAQEVAAGLPKDTLPPPILGKVLPIGGP